MHYYEPRDKHAKNLLYDLVYLNSSCNLKLGVITPELKETLDKVFSSRKALAFLLENGPIIETIPDLPIKIKDHRITGLALAFWKSIESKEVYYVTVDVENTQLVAKGLDKLGIKCSNLIISCKDAFEILQKEKKKRGIV